MSTVQNSAPTSGGWKETGLKIGAWGLLVATFLTIFMGLPLLALNI